MTAPAEWGDIEKIFAASPTGFEVAGGFWVRPYDKDFDASEDVDLDTDLANAGWTNLGYVSADGVQVKIDDSTTPITVWGGGEIAQLRDKFGVEISAELYQALDPEVWAAVIGDEWVSTAAATGQHGARMKVEITPKIPGINTILVESFYGDKYIRQVIPGAQRSAFDDLTLVHNKPLSLKPTWRTVQTPSGKHLIIHTDDGQVISS